MTRSRCAFFLCLLALPAGPALAVGRMQAGDTHLRLGVQRVQVFLEEGLATTEVEQVFHNDSDQVAEAAYDYPLPAEAAFGGISIWVNGKEIQGEVVARARAEAIYREVTGVRVDPLEHRGPAVERVRARPRPTRDPALLQLAARWMRLRVAPIPPRGSQRVKLRYVQPLRLGGGEGRYVLPLALEEVEDAQAERLEVEVLASSRRAPVELASPSHPEGRVQRLPGGAAQFRFARAGARLDRDLELRVRVPSPPSARLGVLAGDEEDGTRTLQLSLTPHVPAVAGGGRDLLLVVDRSTSMAPHARRVRELLAACLETLGPTDRFDLLVCGTSARAWRGELVSVASKRRWQALRFLDDQVHRGVADPTRALRAAARLHRRGRPRPLDLLLLCDAGLSEDDVLLRRLEGPAREAGIRVFALELGASAAAQAPLQRLARRSGGAALAAGRREATDLAATFARALRAPVIRQPRLRVEGVVLSELHPAEPPAVLRAGQTVQLYARTRGRGAGRLLLEGTLPDGRRTRWVFPLNLAVPAAHPDVRRLWARAAVEDLEARLAGCALGRAEREALEGELLRVSLAGPVLSRATSLLVLENEAMFAEHALGRGNRDRVRRERAAQRARERAAQEQPELIALVPGAPPSRREPWGGFDLGGGGHGGGAGDPFFLLLAAGGALVAWRRRAA